MSKEEVLDKLRKMLFTTQQANECGLSNNDFKEDIQTLSRAIELIENKDRKRCPLFNPLGANCTEFRKDFISKDKIKEKIKKYKWASVGYDSDIADYAQSQAIGAYLALIKLLQEGE